jgi:hypothetical protein
MPLKNTHKRDVRLIIILSEDELAAIEDYRFATRPPNRVGRHESC